MKHGKRPNPAPPTNSHFRGEWRWPHAGERIGRAGEGRRAQYRQLMIG